jgi:hypothetical protein
LAQSAIGAALSIGSNVLPSAIEAGVSTVGSVFGGVATVGDMIYNSWDYWSDIENQNFASAIGYTAHMLGDILSFIPGFGTVFSLMGSAIGALFNWWGNDLKEDKRIQEEIDHRNKLLEQYHKIKDWNASIDERNGLILGRYDQRENQIKEEERREKNWKQVDQIRQWNLTQPYSQYNTNTGIYDLGDTRTMNEFFEYHPDIYNKLINYDTS